MNQTIVDIVVSGFAENKADDDIMETMYENGVTFSDLRSTFNQIVKDHELRLTTAERKTKTEAILEGFKPETHEVVSAMADQLANATKVDTKKAMAAIRAYAKRNEIELPKAPRAPKKTKVGFGGHYKTILDHALANRDITKEQLAAFCAEHEIPATYATTAFNMIHFAKQWAGEGVDEDLSEAA